MSEEIKKGSFTIHLSTVETDEFSGYSINGDEIDITVGKETYNRFKKDAERFGARWRARLFGVVKAGRG